jgi:hypothetical protein
MRKLLLAGLTLAAASLAVGQETQVSSNPAHTVGNYSAYRYESCAAPCPPGDINAAIPLVESKRVLDELVESSFTSKNVEEWTNLALYAVKDLNKDDVAVTFVELCRESGGPPHFGHLYGNEPFYASSVAKLFWATALYNTLAQNNLELSLPLRKDVGAMLHLDDHDATNRVVDFVTATESGAELPKADFFAFAKKRGYTNWMFRCIGFQNFNVNQKMWPCDPFGRDLQLLGLRLNQNFENSNRVTSNHAAALMYLLRENAIASQRASCDIMQNIERSVPQKKIGNLQGIADGLPPGSKLWSMQGYTASNFNEVALVTLPNHKQYILSVMTRYPGTYPTTFIMELSRIVAHRQMTRTGDDTPSDGGLLARPRSGE